MLGLNYTGAGLNLSHSLFGCKVCALWFNIYTIDVGLRLNQAYPYFKASQLAAYLGIFWGEAKYLRTSSGYVVTYQKAPGRLS